MSRTRLAACTLALALAIASPALAQDSKPGQQPPSSPPGKGETTPPGTGTPGTDQDRREAPTAPSPGERRGSQSPPPPEKPIAEGTPQLAPGSTTTDPAALKK